MPGKWKTFPMFVGAALLLCQATWGQTVNPPADLLVRIKAKVADMVDHQPNYSCLETIERFQPAPPGKEPALLDTARLQLAEVNGKEMFARPGASQFEDTLLGVSIPDVTIGTSYFVTFENNVFLTQGPVIQRVGADNLNGLPAIRYNYSVPREAGGYLLQSGGKSELVDYRGSFWVNSDTLDLMRLEVQVDDIPRSLGMRSVLDRLNFARVRVGDGDFLLPESATTIVVEPDGKERRHEMTFTSFREYKAESLARIPEPDSKTTTGPASAELQIPAGLHLGIKLTAEIDTAKAQFGDPLEAVLEKDLKDHGRLIAPKGAIVKGHITRIEKGRTTHSVLDSWPGEGGGSINTIGTKPQTYYMIGIALSSIEFPGAKGRLWVLLDEIGAQRAVLEESSTAPTEQPLSPRSLYQFVLLQNKVEEMVFAALSDKVELPRGFHFGLVTQAAAADEK